MKTSNVLTYFGDKPTKSQEALAASYDLETRQFVPTSATKIALRRMGFKPHPSQCLITGQAFVYMGTALAMTHLAAVSPFNDADEHVDDRPIHPYDRADVAAIITAVVSHRKNQQTQERNNEQK